MDGGRAAPSTRAYCGRVTLQGLSLARTTLDRDAAHRARPGLLDELLADPATAVLVLLGDRAPVVEGPAGAELVLLEPRVAAELAGPGPALRVYLGKDGPADGSGGQARVALVRPAPADGDPPVAPPGARWATLRETGAVLDDSGAGLLTAAVAVAQWHAVHPRCARCGNPTEVLQAGWSRGCPQCGAEHYPRTDPAVIMAVVDADDRILLGRQAAWPGGRYSTLAGFVEPGESLEAAVRREVLEEAGVVVGAVTYMGSQPWPFPSSLMLGFSAVALDPSITVDGVELDDARWWSREEFARDLASGALGMPPSVSIARRLVEHWFGGDLPGPEQTWR